MQKFNYPPTTFCLRIKALDTLTSYRYCAVSRVLIQIVIGCFILFCLASPQIAHADECRLFSWDTFTINACSYTSGGSGYLTITNQCSVEATIRYSVTFASGGSYSRFESTGTLAPGQTSGPSCFSGGYATGGGGHIDRSE